MSAMDIFELLLDAWIPMAVLVFVILQFISAPYGRHTREGWGPQISNLVGWLIMETPAVVTFAVCFALGDRNDNVVAIVFLCMWQAHYIHRTFIYPFRMRSPRKKMPLVIALLGATTNVGIGFLNGWYLNAVGPQLDAGWLLDPRFIAGAALFATGLAINIHSDQILLDLRKPGETGYKIPRGGAYRWVSCANYFGEIVEWTGWAIATWSHPGLAFAIWTAANLIPRARTHHAWYVAQFDDYPRKRRAIIPFLY